MNLRLLSCLLVVTCLVAGCSRRPSFAKQGGTLFIVELQPGTTDDGSTKPVTKDDLEQTLRVLEQRLNPDGKKDLLLRQVGEDRIEVDLPGASDTAVAETEQLIKRSAHLEFRLVDAQNPGSLTEAEATTKQRIGFVKLVDKDRIVADAKEQCYILVTNRANMDGKHVKHAFAQLDPAKGWTIMLNFDSEGEKLFGELTAAHIHERLAVVLDNVIISAPNINSAIFGSCEISGKFDERSARELAAALSNPLTNPLKIIETKTISAPR